MIGPKYTNSYVSLNYFIVLVKKVATSSTVDGDHTYPIVLDPFAYIEDCISRYLSPCILQATVVKILDSNNSDFNFLYQARMYFPSLRRNLKSQLTTQDGLAI